MSSTPPSSELNDDALHTLAALRGFTLEFDEVDGRWYIYRDLGTDDCAVDIRVLDTRKEVIYFLSS